MPFGSISASGTGQPPGRGVPGPGAEHQSGAQPGADGTMPETVGIRGIYRMHQEQSEKRNADPGGGQMRHGHLRGAGNPVGPAGKMPDGGA